jgi:hypothetical protein
MTVAALIELLKTLPQKAKVVVYVESLEMAGVNPVETILSVQKEGRKVVIFTEGEHEF